MTSMGMATANASGFSPTTRQLLRRAALFVGFLLSGGMLNINRAALLAILVVLVFMLRSPFNLVRRELVGVWIVVAVVFAVALIGGGDFNVGANAVRLANFIAAALLLLIYIDEPRDLLAIDAYPLLKLFSFQAIVTVAVAVVAPGLFQPLEVNDTVYSTILMIFTFHVTLDDATRFIRPDGFFWEPGVLQIYLNLFLFISLFILKRYRDAALAAFAVLLTQSTSGVIIAGMLIGWAYWQHLRIAGRTQKIFAAILAPALLIPTAGVVYLNVQDKLTGEYRGSAFARQYDAITGFRIALAHPLTGIGFDYDRYYQESEIYGYREVDLDDRTLTERGNSNSFSATFAALGFPIGLLFVFGLVRQRFFVARLPFAALMIVSLIGEALLLTPFFLMFVFSAFLIPTASPSRRSAHGRLPA